MNAASAVAIVMVACLLVMPCSNGAIAAEIRPSDIMDLVTPIRTIDPTDKGFSDLRVLDPLLDGKRIVLLGETDHGDGTTLLAKTRFVKYLHEVHGFDLIIFESGLVDCYYGWQTVCDGGTGQEGFRRGVFGIWSQSRQMAPLMDYLEAEARGSHPLLLAGMRVHLITGWRKSADALEGLVDDVEEAEIPQTQLSAFRALCRWLTDFSESAPSDLPAWLASSDLIECELERAGTSAYPRWEELIIWRRFLHLLPQYVTLHQLQLRGGFQEFQLSEKLDGENIRWLLEVMYPGKKAIVWAANAHVSRMPLDGYLVAGTHVAAHYPDSSLVIAFTGGRGVISRGFFRDRTVPDPEPGSLEAALLASGCRHCYVNLHQGTNRTRLQELFPAGLLNYLYREEPWPRCFDGVVFTATIEPNERAF